MPGSVTTPGRHRLALSPVRVLPSVTVTNVGTRNYRPFAAPWLAYRSPCRRFGRALASTPARLGADVGRYAFIVMDLHHLLLAGLPAHYRLRMGGTGRAKRRWSRDR